MDRRLKIGASMQTRYGTITSQCFRHVTHGAPARAGDSPRTEHDGTAGGPDVCSSGFDKLDIEVTKPETKAAIVRRSTTGPAVSLPVTARSYTATQSSPVSRERYRMSSKSVSS